MPVCFVIRRTHDQRTCWCEVSPTALTRLSDHQASEHCIGWLNSLVPVVKLSCLDDLPILDVNSRALYERARLLVVDKTIHKVMQIVDNDKQPSQANMCLTMVPVTGQTVFNTGPDRLANSSYTLCSRVSNPKGLGYPYGIRNPKGKPSTLHQPSRRGVAGLGTLGGGEASSVHPGRNERGWTGQHIKKLVAPDLHRHADVCAFERGGIVHAVPGHAHHVAPLAQSLHNHILVLRQHLHDARRVKLLERCGVQKQRGYG